VRKGLGVLAACVVLGLAAPAPAQIKSVPAQSVASGVDPLKLNFVPFNPTKAMTPTLGNTSLMPNNFTKGLQPTSQSKPFNLGNVFPKFNLAAIGNRVFGTSNFGASQVAANPVLSSSQLPTMTIPTSKHP
jgi:hypothetical protein